MIQTCMLYASLFIYQTAGDTGGICVLCRFLLIDKKNQHLNYVVAFKSMLNYSEKANNQESKSDQYCYVGPIWDKLMFDIIWISYFSTRYR